MKALFEFLLKFRPVVFEKGHFQFQNAGPAFYLVSLCALAVLLLLHFYIRRRQPVLSAKRSIFLAFHMAVLLLLLIMLAGPAVLVSEINPRESRLAILVDDSRSMQIRDDTIRSRADLVHQLLQPNGVFIRKASDKFEVSYYLFSDRAAAAQGLPEVLAGRAEGRSTNFESGLEQIDQELAHLPLAGVVVISDGADNASRRLNETVEKLRSQKIPVHTIGVGNERLDRDVELLHVSVPRTMVPESICTAVLTLRNRGFGGRRVRVDLRDGDSLIQSRPIDLQYEKGTQTVEFPFSISGAGVKNLKFSVEELPGDILPQNNWTQTVLEARASQPRILYVEGEPRWEYKFLRRALADDHFLRVETLLRTANNKFYRQGVESEDTLAAGFPSQSEELFQYQGLILGTVESSFFTYHQLEMIRDFVGKRGGGFLMTGGQRSFGGGKYQNTPVEEILPVHLLGLGSIDYREGAVHPEVTLYARNQSILSLPATLNAAQSGRTSVPPLEDFHALTEVKPAAIVLANAGSAARAPVLVATQRYGRGQALVFASGSSWLWQMGLDRRDTSHEDFWRQLLRWMVHEVPGQISITPDKAEYVAGETAVVRAEVFDKSYDKVSQTSPILQVTGPDGRPRSYPMEWTAVQDGIYSSSVPVDKDGIYQFQVSAEVNGENVKEQYYLRTSPSNLEFHDAGQHVDFLKMLAAQSGGRYYPIGQANDLPEEVIYQAGKTSRLQVKELWDAPVFYFLIVGMMAAEWALRRKWGQP